MVNMSYDRMPSNGIHLSIVNWLKKKVKLESLNREEKPILLKIYIKLEFLFYFVIAAA